MVKSNSFTDDDHRHMALALDLARRGFGRTSPNPMVGAVLVKRGRVIGKGWHRRAGTAHAEIAALRNAKENPAGGTLYVTLEPCCTHGRTPPCTDAIIRAGILRVVVAGTDPNPAHRGRGFALLRRAGIQVEHGPMGEEECRLNEAFRHWIVNRTPFVTVKAAMSLDGKTATRTGESKWITGAAARREGMKLRAGADAILAGVKTIIQDDPSLTLRAPGFRGKTLRRIVLDPSGRMPVRARVATDELTDSTLVVVTKAAPANRVAALEKRVRVLVAPATIWGIDLRCLLRQLGAEGVTSLLVEGGGETVAAFVEQHLAHRAVFFYAPIAIGGATAPKAVGGTGLAKPARLREVEWRRAGTDLYLTGRVIGAK